MLRLIITMARMIALRHNVNLGFCLGEQNDLCCKYISESMSDFFMAIRLYSVSNSQTYVKFIHKCDWNQ